MITVKMVRFSRPGHDYNVALRITDSSQTVSYVIPSDEQFRRIVGPAVPPVTETDLVDMYAVLQEAESSQTTPDWTGNGSTIQLIERERMFGDGTETLQFSKYVLQPAGL